MSSLLTPNASGCKASWQRCCKTEKFPHRPHGLRGIFLFQDITGDIDAAGGGVRQ